jgi:hypothetical protein
MAKGVKMQPRALASATVVPPQEQETGFLGQMARTEYLPMLNTPQRAKMMSTDFEKRMKKRLRRRALAVWACSTIPFSFSKVESSSLDCRRWL